MILYIKANPKPDDVSRTFQISERFVESYKETHPNDEIVTLDLYQKEIDFLSLGDINSIFAPKNDGDSEHPILKYAYQFLDADKYIIAAPLWNLSIPAILKAYIDYITVSGITFKYTAEGPVGLCYGKKAVHIVSRGGGYSEEPMSNYEMGDRYLRTLFGFLGITDFTTIAAENLDSHLGDPDSILNKAIEEAKNKAKDF